MEKNISKCLVIGGLTVVFWIVSLFISGLVNDRSRLSVEAQNEISQTWSKEQSVVGPIICVPVYSAEATAPYTCMYVLPEHIEVDADVQSEVLHRGIFDASVYRSKIEAKGAFDLREMSSAENVEDKKHPVHYDWTKAQIIVAIKDIRGIEEGFQLEIGEKKVELNRHFYNYGSSSIKYVLGNNMDAITALADLSGMVGNEVSFNLEASLKGSRELNVAPTGRNSQITMHGNCLSPSFDGMLLPSTREVTDAGFTSTWKVNSLNRNDVAQAFCSVDEQKNFQTVGTKFLIMGGQYTQTDRALKYAFLVILLSLVAVFVAEMSVKIQINILNYLLIGAALVLFYLLLLSFGEWMGFAMAYLLSAVLVVGMITLYLKGIVGNGKIAMAVCFFMVLVDIFIYILLGIEEMSLLVGTLGLFVVLGIAMFFSLRMTVKKNS